MTNKMKQISVKKTITIFGLSTLYFFILLFTLLPFLKSHFVLNPALYWFITGYFLFIPLLMLAIILTEIEGNKSKIEILNALNIKPMTKKDCFFSVVFTSLVFAFTGLIFQISLILNKYFGISQLNTTPWFMKINPFQGNDRFLLLIWLPMFVFNIVGEEFLWRGYIQSRLQCKLSWLLCSLLWLMFHLPFGMDLMIMLLPVIILLPYAFDKTHNTLVGVFIHGVYNGPIFVLVALGIMKL